MTSITKEVWKYLDEDVVIRRAIEKDIVSLKSLASYIIRTNLLNHSTHSVISAIRRYSLEMPLEKKFSLAKKVVNETIEIRVISNIVNICVERSRKNQESIEKILPLIKTEKGEMFLLIQGERSIKIFVNKKNVTKVMHLFEKTAIVEIEDKLAEINLQLPKEAKSTPGIMAYVTNEFTLHDINIVETMSCLPELLFFIKQKDVVKSYLVLSKICNNL